MHKFTVEIESPDRPEDFVEWLRTLPSPGVESARLVSVASPPPPRLEDLLPYQRAWVEDQAPFKVWDCDRRLGATTAVIEKAIAVSSDPDGGPVVIVTAGERDLREAARDLQERGITMFRFRHGWRGETAHPLLVTTAKALSRAMETREPLLQGELDPGELALAVLDNALGYGALPMPMPGSRFFEDIGRVVSSKPMRRLAIVTTGAPVCGRGRWRDFILCAPYSDFSIHYTSAALAFSQGLGRKVCAVQGLEWTPEWEAERIEQMRKDDPEGLSWRL